MFDDRLSLSSSRLTFFRFHWGFLIGPKIEKKANVPGTRFHVKNQVLPSGAIGWAYEENHLPNVQSTNRLLARIVIAKVEDGARLIEIFRSIPVVQNDPNWRCRTWVWQVLERLKADGGKAVGTAQLDWGQIEGMARSYVAQKQAHGRYATMDLLLKPKPTWDMLENKEMVP